MTDKEESARQDALRAKARNLPRGVLRDAYRRAKRNYFFLKKKRKADPSIPLTALTGPAHTYFILQVEMENRGVKT